MSAEKAIQWGERKCRRRWVFLSRTSGIKGSANFSRSKNGSGVRNSAGSFSLRLFRYCITVCKEVTVRNFVQIFIASAHSFVFPLGLMSGVTTARAPR